MTFFPGQARIPEIASYSIRGVYCTAFRFANLGSFSEYYANMFFDLQTAVNANGRSVTTLLRTIRPNKEDRVAIFEWAANGGLGRMRMGKVCLILLRETKVDFMGIHQNMLQMADMVRPDLTIQVCDIFQMHDFKGFNNSRGRTRL